MPPMDMTGKNLHQGQLVHVHLNGMFTANVAGIVDSKLTIPGQQALPPMVVLEIGLQIPIQNNHVPVYIVKNAEPPKGEEVGKQVENVKQFTKRESSADGADKNFDLPPVPA